MNADEQNLPDQVDLVAARERGDKEYIAASFERHRDRLRRAVELRMDPNLRGRADASDVIQETFVEAMARVDDYLDRVDAPLYVWLRGLATQKLLQFRRYHVEAQRREARREVPLDERLGGQRLSDCRIADLLIAGSPSPSSLVGREEQTGAVIRALEKLDEIDREIVLLRCLEGLSNGETASILRMNGSTTSTRFHRTLKRIRAALGTGNDSDSDDERPDRQEHDS